MQTPRIIAVLTTQRHQQSVFCDGVKRYNACTEKDCARWLAQHVDGWPSRYQGGPGSGTGWRCLAIFQRTENEPHERPLPRSQCVTS
jgi:hypothetical protein